MRENGREGMMQGERLEGKEEGQTPDFLDKKKSITQIILFANDEVSNKCYENGHHTYLARALKEWLNDLLPM